MSIEELNNKLTLQMDKDLNGKDKATKYGVNSQLLLEGIKNLAKISNSLQSNRAELEIIKLEKKKLLKLMELAAKKQNESLDLKDRGYIGIFNQYSPEVIATDNAPFCLKMEEYNQILYDNQIPITNSDPSYYHQSPPRHR